MRHRKIFTFMLVVSFPAHVTVTAQTKEPLKLVATIPLPGLKDGDFDHFAPDPDGHRLFLTDEENDKVDVLDTATNTRIHTIEDAKAPHAILYRKDLKKLFIVEAMPRLSKSMTAKRINPLAKSKYPLTPIQPLTTPRHTTFMS